jgi:hypothetical protein
VGLGLAQLAECYPAAQLLGVEADPDNAELAVRNVAPFADRVRVVSAAVWDRDCELTLEGRKECGLEVRERREDDPVDLPRISAYAVESLLADWRPEGEIDYVLLSAEHSEERILTRSNGWLERVRSIRVETYEDIPYGPAQTIRDIERLGFRARYEPGPTGSVVGVRPRKAAE